MSKISKNDTITIMVTLEELAILFDALQDFRDVVNIWGNPEDPQHEERVKILGVLSDGLKSTLLNYNIEFETREGTSYERVVDVLYD